MKIEAAVCAYWRGLTGGSLLAPPHCSGLCLYAELFLTASSAANDSVMERLFDGSPDRPIDWLSYWLYVKVMN